MVIWSLIHIENCLRSNSKSDPQEEIVCLFKLFKLKPPTIANAKYQNRGIIKRVIKLKMGITKQVAVICVRFLGRRGAKKFGAEKTKRGS